MASKSRSRSTVRATSRNRSGSRGGLRPLARVNYREASSSRSRSRSRSRSSMRSNASTASGFGNDVQTSFKKRGANISKPLKGAKKVKVPVKFAKQVNQVLTKKSPFGTVLESYMIKYQPSPLDTQANFNLGQGWDPTNANTTDAGRLMFFDPCRIIDAASVLFNGKTFSGTKSLSNSGLFSGSTLQVEVLNQNVGFEIKNNTARRMTIKLWTWKLKDKMRLTADFTGYWKAACNEENTAARLGKINCYGISPNMIGGSPMLSPRMRETFTMEEKIIHLEAGKQTYHQINGFRGVYDFSKFWDGATFNNYNKNVMGVCMGFYPDLITTTGITGNASRTTDIDSSDPWGIAVETRCRYTIRMPEQTGFVLPATYTAGSKKLDFRREHPYAVRHVAGTGTGSVALINDENPESQAVDGL